MSKFFCLFVLVWCRFQQFVSHITTVSGCDRELNAHFYSAASLKYHAPDTWHDTTSSHIILTLGRPVLAPPHKSKCQARSSQYHFKWLWYVAAQDWTHDLQFSRQDTLPTELPGLFNFMVYWPYLDLSTIKEPSMRPTASCPPSLSNEQERIFCSSVVFDNNSKLFMFHNLKG